MPSLLSSASSQGVYVNLSPRLGQEEILVADTEVPSADLSYCLERHRGGFLLGCSYYLQEGFLLGLGYFVMIPGAPLKMGRPGEEMEESTDSDWRGLRGGLF